MGAIGDPYITADELKAYLNIDETKASFNLRLADSVNSASREIEQFCGRQFNKTTTASTRIYDAKSAHWIEVDDFHTTDGLLIEIGDSLGAFNTIVDPASVTLYPLSGVVDGMPGWPYHKLVFMKDWIHYYGKNSRSNGRVRVTAQWGWDEVPSSVRQAAFLLAAQTFKLADAPFGVAGMDQFGAPVRVRDLPQVASKLNRFVTTPIMIG